MHNKKAWRQELQDVLTHNLSSKLETIKRNPHLSMQSNLFIPKGPSTTNLGALISWPLILVLMKSLQSDYCRLFLQCKIRAALASPQTSSLSCLSQHLFSEAWLPRWIFVPNFERLHFKRLGGEKNHGTRVLLLNSWRIDASKIKTAAWDQWDSHILGLPIKLSYCCSVWLASLGCCHILWQCSRSPRWGQSAKSTITHY